MLKPIHILSFVATQQHQQCSQITKDKSAILRTEQPNRTECLMRQNTQTDAYTMRRLCAMCERNTEKIPYLYECLYWYEYNLKYRYTKRDTKFVQWFGIKLQFQWFFSLFDFFFICIVQFDSIVWLLVCKWDSLQRIKTIEKRWQTGKTTKYTIKRVKLHLIILHPRESPFFSIYFQWNLLHSFYEIIVLNHFNLNDDHLSKLFFKSKKNKLQICTNLRHSQNVCGNKPKAHEILGNKIETSTKKKLTLIVQCVRTRTAQRR